MSALPRIMVTLVLAALPFGCGARVEMALVDPAKYQFHSCEQLEREMKQLRERAHELQALRDKATRDPAGAFVAGVAYEPDYLTTLGNMELVETAAREKNCSPPIVGMAGAPAR
jgi:hypothetical protein